MNYRLHRIKLTWNFIILIVLLTSFNTVFAGEGIQGITQVEGTEFEVGEQFTVQYILKSVGQRLQGNYQISGNNFGELEVLGQNSGNSTSIINGSIKYFRTEKYSYGYIDYSSSIIHSFQFLCYYLHLESCLAERI